MRGVFVRGRPFSRWHTNEEDFRDYHLLLNGDARQIFAMTDDAGERMRKIGRTLHKRHIRTTMPQEEQRRIRCAG